jgi:two-component system, OmpR family, KDP operon response regulator KdpE
MTIEERPTRILAVDDEERIRRALSTILKSRGYALELATCGDDALRQAIDKPPDLVILDLSLPDRSGIEVCHELRSWMKAPILILSVRSGEADKIAALDEGADDYLTKPFSAGELLARVRALLRRAREAVTPPPVMTVSDMVVDVGRRRVTLAGREVGSLTPTEFDILAYLARNAGFVVTHRQILEHVWGPSWVDDVATLRVHVSNLRKKVEPKIGARRYIFTEPGVGFRFASAQQSEASTDACGGGCG